MAITLTTKFADKVDERYYPMTVSAAGTNQNYDWDGAQTIKVTSVSTGTMKDYDRNTGYGAVSTADNLSNTLQTLTLRKERFFRMKLDKMDEEESKIKSEEVLARQLREVTLPEIEAYRFGEICKSIVTNKASQEVTATASAYTDFLTANEKLDDADVPQGVRVAYCTPEYLNKLKLDPNFIKASDLAQGMLIKGQVGEVDGIPIISTKKAWLTDGNTGGASNYHCIIVDRNTTVAPIKLADYSANTNHPDFDGTVFQGRFYYDAFVLDMKKKGLVGIKRP